MSGIVRGWTDDFELPLVIIKRPHTPAEVPVAVVPLDDATLKTLAGEIWRHLPYAEARLLSTVDTALRAALGLEGGA